MAMPLLQHIFVACSLMCLLMLNGASSTTLAGNLTHPAWCSGSTQFYCHLSDDCKPAYVKCDGTAQCPRGEDELNCVACTETTAPSQGMFFCKDSDVCVSLDWKCDGTPDCSKGEDEAGCDTAVPVPCTATQFDCGDNQCIDDTWRCDDQYDCTNSADEKNCEATCAPGQFVCAGNDTTPVSCISMQWYCDGDTDCPNGEDELNCVAKECPSDRFNCSAEEKCMPKTWMCDGDNDCSSGEDEAGCHLTTAAPVRKTQCTQLEFQCVSGSISCIIGAWKCDTEPDCSDGSDELNCGNRTVTCDASQFLCAADNDCIPRFLLCNGKNECSDGADEKLPRCHANQTTKHCDLTSGEFSCNEDPSIKSTCITFDKVCDGKRDCMSNRDESAEEFCGSNAPSDRCSNNRCGTSPLVKCINVRTELSSNFNRSVGYICECPPGYVHASNDCHDINECQASEKPVCDQECVNEPGTYKCSCDEGYTLQTDLKTCKVNGNVLPKLLFTNRDDIRSVHIHGRGGYMPLLDSKSAVALDFDYSKGEVFYSDTVEKKLYKFVWPSPDTEDDLSGVDLEIPGMQTPDGLAYDWVYKHLYWTDTTANTINMACIDDEIGQRHTTVLYKNEDPTCAAKNRTGNSVCLDEPRALVVHPKKGWVFWSDWGTKPHIALAALDGSKMEMIAYNTDKNRQYLLWPNGLTLDLSNNNERLYWIDARLHSLFSCTIDRCLLDIEVLVYNTHVIKHPFSITVFENRLYWSDWSKKHIASANKYTGGDIETLLPNLVQPMDLKVYHPMSQQNSTNHCKGVAPEEACQHICVPKPWARSAGSNNFEAIPQDKRQYSCLCSTGHTLHADGRSCTDTVTTTSSPENPTGSGLLVVSEATATVRRIMSNSVSDGMSIGTVAAIASTIVLVLAVIIAGVIFVVLRQKRLKKSKRMNFDNPIYKRTTEDKLELPRHEYLPSQTDPSATVPLTSPESPSTSQEFDV